MYGGGRLPLLPTRLLPPLLLISIRDGKISRDQTSRISVLGNAEASAYLQVNSGGVRAPSLLHWRSKGQWWRLVFIDKLIFLETSILMFAVTVNFWKNSHFQTSICSPPFPCQLSVGEKIISVLLNKFDNFLQECNV